MCFLRYFLVDVFLSRLRLFVFLFCWKVAQRKILFGIVGQQKIPHARNYRFAKKKKNKIHAKRKLNKSNTTFRLRRSILNPPSPANRVLKYANVRLLQSFCRLCVFRLFFFFFRVEFCFSVVANATTHNSIQVWENQKKKKSFERMI